MRWEKTRLALIALLGCVAACGAARHSSQPAGPEGGASGTSNNLAGAGGSDAGQGGATTSAGAAGATAGAGRGGATGGSSGGVGGTGVGGTGVGGQTACNEIANTAEVIEAVEVHVDPPLPAGGVIEDGTYHLTSRIIYTGNDGPSGGRTELMQVTMVVNGDHVESVGGEVGTPLERRSASYELDGTNLTLHVSCPSGVSDEVHPFSATSESSVASFSIHHDEGAATRVETWVKQ